MDEDKELLMMLITLFCLEQQLIRHEIPEDMECKAESAIQELTDKLAAREDIQGMMKAAFDSLLGL